MVKVTNYKVPTIAEMVKVGDYIEYLPDIAECTTDVNKTGYTSVQTLRTETKDWRVLYIDEEKGEVVITPYGTLSENSAVALKDIKGFMGGKDELNRVCSELYSNRNLGVQARSIMLKDLDKACGITDIKSVDPEYGEGYAYYPYGTTFAEGDTTIEYNGKVYKKVVANNDSKFYFSDGGGVENTDENGFRYRSMKAGELPVFVSSNVYSYEFTDKIKEIINDSYYFFLADQSLRNDLNKYVVYRISMRWKKNDI